MHQCPVALVLLQRLVRRRWGGCNVQGPTPAPHANTIVSNAGRRAHWCHPTHPATTAPQHPRQTNLDRLAPVGCYTISNNDRLPGWLPCTCTTSAATARATSAPSSPPPRAGGYYNGAKILPQFIISLASPPNALAASPHGHGNVWWVGGTLRGCSARRCGRGGGGIGRIPIIV